MIIERLDIMTKRKTLGRIKSEETHIIEPNITYIKNRLTNEFINLINNNNNNNNNNNSVKIIDKRLNKKKWLH
jgi:hypothetical protein